MKNFKPFFALMIFVILLASCTPAAKGPSEIKIAVLAPLSGPVPTFGEMTRDAALMAIEEWNAKGGVLGAKIDRGSRRQPMYS